MRTYKRIVFLNILLLLSEELLIYSDMESNFQLMRTISNMPQVNEPAFSCLLEATAYIRHNADEDKSHNL